MTQLRRVLSDLLGTVPSAQIIIDGLDECDPASQSQALAEFLTMSRPKSGLAKVLVLSREGGTIDRTLRKEPALSLREESDSVNNDIDTFVKVKLWRTRSEWDFNVSDNSLAKVEQALLSRAKG